MTQKESKENTDNHPKIGNGDSAGDYFDMGVDSADALVGNYFTKIYGNAYTDPNGLLRYSPREVLITDDSGKVIEKIEGAIFPETWSQHAANTTATKYFRKTDVQKTGGREIDIRQLSGRVAKKIVEWGVDQGYIDERGAKLLEQQIVSATVGQYGAYNSPVWFNLGLDLYGVKTKEGDTDKSYNIVDGKPAEVKNYYANPQVSACFICSPTDSIEDMVNVSAVISSRIFKGGSGIGGDWSHIRSAGEPVSGGGYASGAVRFMDVQDSVGRVIKSGGKTRRAATMQSIGVWHPDMPEILKHKYKEEMKAGILIEAGSPFNWESHTIQDLRAQNVNISIRTDDSFWQAYERGENYPIKAVKDGHVIKEEPARKLAKLIAFAAHSCGDPGIQNHTTINKWNTCKKSFEIWASNPCSEYMFADNSACNLASINLMKFRREDDSFDLEGFYNAVDLYITTQDIMVSKASYPIPEVALNSHLFRPIGLGYANLGAYIMSLGIPYDSDEARNFSAAITSNLTAEAYLQSTRLAERLGAFQEYEKNKDSMHEVIEMHARQSKHIPKENGIEELVNAANKKWGEVIERGRKHGFRNAQVTLLAPTGTIGFMMGCDTTGCEPEYQLKKYKELAGGGSMVIVNETVPLALQKLGYSKDDIDRIVDYIDKKGTIEGCDLLMPEHLPVFDCSVSAGDGTRAIHPMGHIKMLSVIQPYLSGAISKTINCPQNTTVEEIENMFYQGWKQGLKAVAIYRDGSKASQPLKTKKSGKLEILARGKREPLPKERFGMIRKVNVGGINLFITTGEYADGRLGELFLESLERGSEVNRLLNEVAIEFSEKLQYGVPLDEAISIFQKAGNSQIAGITDHEFIKIAKGPEGFLFDFLRAHYLGDISFIQRGRDIPEMRPLPHDLRIYQRVPRLHLIPEVYGEKMYPGVPSLEEIIKAISKTNYWIDNKDGLDTRQTIEKIRSTRLWKNVNNDNELTGRMTGRMCDKGHLMISDGKCFKCPICKTASGNCGGT
ncbi:MAG: vitamin B12-dependent ribonucleotide reductase [Nanoarchaeota archaeon]|nr:vitamin B12-dependent ribonucleotide reductase [Nanoarchaeota archaeon]